MERPPSDASATRTDPEPFAIRVVIRSAQMYRAIIILPWLLLASAAIILTDHSPIRIGGSVLFSTGLIAAACSLLAFRQLIDRIPEALQSLWDGGIVVQRDAANRVVAPTGHEKHPPVDAPSAPDPEERQRYQTQIEQLMNWPGAWLVRVLFIGVVIYYYERTQGVIGTAGLIFEAAVAFCIGFAAWRMIAIGWWRLALDKEHGWRPLRRLFRPIRFRRKSYVLQPLRFLGCDYVLTPHLRHPDRCGGLEPLAKLCFWNAVVISCAGIYLGGWLILANVHKVFGHAIWDEPIVTQWVTIFQTLLVLPVVFALLSFFGPIWGLHRSMLRERERLRHELDDLAEEIERLAQKMLEDAKESATYNADDASADSKKLDLMRKVYAQDYAAPVWPLHHYGTVSGRKGRNPPCSTRLFCRQV